MRCEQVQDTLARTLQQTRDQLAACREAKHRMEMDWSDKYSAQALGIVFIVYLSCENY